MSDRLFTPAPIGNRRDASAVAEWIWNDLSLREHRLAMQMHKARALGEGFVGRGSEPIGSADLLMRAFDGDMYGVADHDDHKWQAPVGFRSAGELFFPRIFGSMPSIECLYSSSFRIICEDYQDGFFVDMVPTLATSVEIISLQVPIRVLIGSRWLRQLADGIRASQKQNESCSKSVLSATEMLQPSYVVPAPSNTLARYANLASGTSMHPLSRVTAEELRNWKSQYPQAAEHLLQSIIYMGTPESPKNPWKNIGSQAIQQTVRGTSKTGMLTHLAKKWMSNLAQNLRKTP